MYLYHQHNSHYDLLVHRQYANPPPNLSSPVEESLSSAPEISPSVSPLIGTITGEGCASSPVLPPSSPVLPPTSPVLPPSRLQFYPHVKSKGRPKKGRYGPPSFNKKSSEPTKARLEGERKRKNEENFDPNQTPVGLSPPAVAAKKRRGRPKGSKNKPKGGKCMTCHFDFDFTATDPRELVVKCSDCGISVHQSCLKACENCQLIGKP